MWADIYDLIRNSKCKVILLVNDNFFMLQVFKDFLYKSYDKKYQNHNARKTTHNIFCNFK